MNSSFNEFFPIVLSCQSQNLRQHTFEMVKNHSLPPPFWKRYRSCVWLRSGGWLPVYQQLDSKDSQRRKRTHLYRNTQLKHYLISFSLLRYLSTVHVFECQLQCTMHVYIKLWATTWHEISNVTLCHLQTEIHVNKLSQTGCKMSQQSKPKSSNWSRIQNLNVPSAIIILAI